jgi:hypothetical protein
MTINRQLTAQIKQIAWKTYQMTKDRSSDRLNVVEPKQATRKGWPYYTRPPRGSASRGIVGVPLAGTLLGFHRSVNAYGANPHG